MGRATIKTDSLIMRKSSQNAPTVNGHICFLQRVPIVQKQAFRQHVVDNQKSYATILRQNTAPPQPQDETFTFSAEQVVKLVANVAIKVSQPQVCYINSPQDAIDKKSSMYCRVSEAAKTHLGVDITGSSLFNAIGHLRHPAPSAPEPKTFLIKSEAPFKFTSFTKVTKSSAILKTLSPTNKPNKTFDLNSQFESFGCAKKNSSGPVLKHIQSHLNLTYLNNDEHIHLDRAKQTRLTNLTRLSPNSLKLHSRSIILGYLS